jgi:hypothetical protein
MRKCGIVNTLSSRRSQSTQTGRYAPLCPAAATTTAALLMRRSQRLWSARRYAGRRCQGCKDAHCVRPVVTHWGCERARPGQHSANALRRLGTEVVRRAVEDADHQDQDQDSARRDARPGGFVHRIGCRGCDDDDCDGRTTAAPLCPFGSDRTWGISAVRARALVAAVAEVAADPDATAVAAAPLCPFGADRRWEIGAARAEPSSVEAPSPAMATAGRTCSHYGCTGQRECIDDIADRVHTWEEYGRYLARIEASKQCGRAEREERVQKKKASWRSWSIAATSRSSRALVRLAGPGEASSRCVCTAEASSTTPGLWSRVTSLRWRAALA